MRLKQITACITAILLMTGNSLLHAAPPNVVLVITDDQGYGDLSCHGNPVLKTPHLDTLHAESVRLTQYHVSPTCAPTRGALMSGHFTDRAGPWHTIMGRSFLFEGEKTLGELYQQQGYATGMFGKWHLGDNYPFRPEDRGFSEVVRHGGGGVGQAPDYWDNAYFDDTYFHNSKPQKYQGYCTDVWFAEARRFIGDCKTAKKPFFAYIATNAPHGPLLCPEKWSEPYRNTAKLPMATALFFGMIANIDDQVGALRAWLKEEGLAENTIFIFTTDNGSASGTAVHSAGMKAGKGSPYEGGHRVPLFIHWPAGGISHGTDINRLTAHVDILPTLMELCALPLPTNYKLDGRSLVPLIRDPAAEWPDRVLTTDSQRVRDPIKWRNCSTMSDRWRLVNGKELYDIQADPGQTKNVADEHPEVVAQLTAAYEAWWTDLQPAFARQARIIVGSTHENPSRLSSHDWLTDSDMVPWNHGAVRSGKGGHGKWALRVAEAGTYQVTLMRWPPEADAAICSGLPAGANVPGNGADRARPGLALAVKEAVVMIGGQTQRLPVTETMKGATFELTLQVGEADLEGNFVLADGKEIGAFYAVVGKKQ